MKKFMTILVGSQRGLVEPTFGETSRFYDLYQHQLKIFSTGVDRALLSK